jgi:hypothetical protein
LCLFDKKKYLLILNIKFMFTRMQTFIAFLSVVLIAAVLFFAYRKENKNMFSEITDDDTEMNIDWHDAIGRNNIALQREVVATHEGKNNWWNFNVPKGVKHGFPGVEFKEDPMISGISDEATVSTDSVIYGNWQNPMEVFPSNTGPFKSKRVVRNKDWDAVVVGVPGGTPEQINKRLDSIYMPNKNNITAEDRTKYFTDTDFPGEGGGPYSRGEYYNTVYAPIPPTESVIRASQPPTTVVQNGAP